MVKKPMFLILLLFSFISYSNGGIEIIGDGISIEGDGIIIDSGGNSKEGINIGTNNKVGGNKNSIHGHDNEFYADNSQVIGTGNKVNKDTNSKNVGIFGNLNIINYTENSNILGNGNELEGEKDKLAEGNSIIGFNNKAKKSLKNTFVLGKNIKAEYNNSIYIGNESKNAEEGSSAYKGESSGILSIGSKGKERIIQNVAEGLISKHSTDAINGSQIYGVIENFESKINNISSEAKTGVALSVAMANLPHISGRNNILASFGVYKNVSAIAVGLGGVNRSSNVGYKLSGALNSKGDVSFGVGVGYKFSDDLENDDIKILKYKISELESKYEEIQKQNMELLKILKNKNK